ncbi:diguanylate cyclase [Sphingomonas naasensis]|uniref:diguanylate cyclase n=1 Tax=Sphingomonas naasensis TaxID=1344951 RepID=A0A4S1WGQ9_9SPHN|nr:GGDEF domain-containing protein [Sphingomonas naasensis]NIJ22135.1 diguanylate cyclase [Sphingomonas naasensis]TGX42199.1 GGDEF domain-containing protein [Sphingomonas naasensis]
MVGARAVRAASQSDSSRRLYDRIGEFLVDQRLDPDPGNYAFAYHLLADPEGPLARAVYALTDGGVRLTQRDIEKLGCDVQPTPNAKDAKQKADGLVAATQMQVEGFQDMVTAIRAETQGFGRDLAASAEAISRSGEADNAGVIGEVARITAGMIERVHSAEARLESATREASELRQKLEEARDNARRDPLTDLPNRRALEEAYAAQAATGAAICLAVCDVDHFKSVNDRFGHAVGDRVLKAIAEALGQTCAGHLVARYGGEEFAVLFTGVSIESARATLDAARATVATKRYRLRESDAPLGEITFSAGLAAAEAGDGLSTVFHRADRLLYAAKTAGRNCLLVG